MTFGLWLVVGLEDIVFGNDGMPGSGWANIMFDGSGTILRIQMGAPGSVLRELNRSRWLVTGDGIPVPPTLIPAAALAGICLTKPVSESY